MHSWLGIDGKEKRKRKREEDTTSAATTGGERSHSSERHHDTERSGLFTLADCGSDVQSAVDIIAVHGLGGHWDETWTGTAKKNWLRDFLPKQLRDKGIAARILSFGYDSRTAFTKAVIDIGDVANMLLTGLDGRRESERERSRPLISISHSLGGIVTKKAIIRAHERSQLYDPLLQNIRGVVFMGVPHRGAGLAFWGSLAANILRFTQLGWETNPKFVEELRRNSKTITDISEQFVERAQSLSTICTFFETERLGNQVIVDKGSAVLNLNNEIAVGVPEANHQTIFWNPIRKLCQRALKDNDITLQSTSITDISPQTTYNGRSPFPDAADNVGPLKQIPDDDTHNKTHRYQSDKAQCHRAFETSDYENQKNVNPDRADGTCRWALEHTRYREWHDNPYDGLLWISADPGCGKSVLSKSLIDRDLSESHAHTVCYFFFKDNENQDNLAIALCALIHQLFSSQPELIQYAVPSWTDNGDRVQQEADKLWRILLNACGSAKARNTICVLDALDECRDSDRKRLIALLTTFYTNRMSDESSSGWLKFLVTSRPYEAIQDHFSENLQSLPSIRLRGEEENDQIRHEIDLVIEEKVEKLASNLKLATGIKDNLKSQLLAMEHRTYLWLYLATEEIKETYRESFRPHNESIRLLPTTVEDAYESILKRGAIRNKDEVYRILRIVIGARRPLSVAEMAIALSVDTSPPSELKLDIDADYVAEHLPNWCGLFVFINHSKIYLIHQTAKEFLAREGTVAEANNQGWKHCLSMTEVELSMTTICVRYLVEKDISHLYTTYSEDDPTIDPDDADTFWVYSAEHWAGHVRSILDEVSLFPMDMVMKLYNFSEPRFQHWFPVSWRAIEKQWRYIVGDMHSMNNIMLAALAGHNMVLQRLLETNQFDLEKRDRRGRTALILGSKYGYKNIVKILLDNGADINAENALMAAAHEGHKEIVQLLLDNGADVNAYGGSALWSASIRGRSEVVRLLIDNGVDIKAQCNNNDNNALWAASSIGHREIVQLLLDNGADVNAYGGEYGNALQAASINGKSEIVRLLLDNGADINAQDGKFGNTLQAASINGKSEIVRLLLDNGADINAQDGKFGNTQQAA